MIGKSNPAITVEDILKVTDEATIASYYLGIDKIPTTINSPFRKDNHPSFGINSPDGKKVRYIDYSTGERGGVFDIVMQLYHISFKEALERVHNDLCYKKDINITKRKNCHIESNNDRTLTKIEVKVRDWEDYDIKYWQDYGISLEWLRYAEVYPISHKIIYTNDKRYVLGADKYAYVYVERKENNISYKIYQPFNKKYKWLNSNDTTVIGLWTKVPESGEHICICSSLKDALCLWSNTGIPSIYIQGEGYSMSDTAVSELKRRFKNVYVLFDNDKPGKIDAKKLTESTGFTNIELPQFQGGKDISDFYKCSNKNVFVLTIFNLFNLKMPAQHTEELEDDSLPF